MLFQNLLFIGTAELIILFILFFIFILPIGASIYDILKRDFSNKTTDLILIIALLLFIPTLGSLMYLFLLRKNYPLKIS